MQLSHKGLLLAGCLGVSFVGLSLHWLLLSPGYRPAASHYRRQAHDSPPAPIDGVAPGFVTAHVDLGNVLWGQSIPLDLEFCNSTDHSMLITHASTTCACTLVDSFVTPVDLPPGASLIVPVEFHTVLRPGPKASAVILRTQTGETYRATITARVNASWTVKPQECDFGEVEFALAPASVLELRFRSSTARLEAVGTEDAAWIRAEIARPVSSTFEARILLHVQPDRLLPGMNTGLLTVRTDDPVVPVRQIPVRISVRWELVVCPPQLVLWRGNQERVRVYTPDGRPADIARTMLLSSDKDEVVLEPLGHGQVSVRVASNTTATGPWLAQVVDPHGRIGRWMISVADWSTSQAEDSR